MYKIKINIAADNAVGDPLYMEDWGLKIEFEGLTLPTAYEVHFSNNPASPAKMAIGDSSGVVVPYEYTAKSGTLYGWLVFTNPSSGYTKRAFTIAITRRSPLDPPQVLPPQATVIEQAIVALNTAIERTEAARDAAAASAEEAETSATNAANSAAESAASATAASESATAAAESAADASASQATAQAAATRAENAMIAARASAESADESAGLAQTAVEESADNAMAAAESASQAAASKAQAATDATRANTYATRAQASANTASDKATSASNSAGAALNHANNAAASATAAGQAQTAAEAAAGTATEKAAEAGQSATDAAESAAEAQAAATEAGQIVDDVEAWALGAYATSSASGAVATVDDGAEGVPVKALKAYIVPVQDGSGDPSPDNVRPIHGFTGMKLKRTGKNLWSPTGFRRVAGEQNPVTLDGGVYTMTWTTGALSFDSKNIQTFPAGSYAIEAAGENVGNVKIYIYSARTGTLIAQGTTGMIRTFSVPFYIGFGGDYQNPGSATFTIQVELGSFITPYEPYQGTLYPVSWETEAGTVYGGYFDAVTGVLTVTHAAVDMGTLNWTYNSTAAWNCFATSGVYSKKAGSFNLMCERYAVKTVYGTSDDNIVAGNINNSTITVRDTSYNGDTAAFKAAVTGQTLVYELANPITYNLTPLDVRTLRGVNNIFTDTGDTDATVRADPDLHINKLIAEAVALALESA